MSLLRTRVLAAWRSLVTHQTDDAPLVSVGTTLAEAIVSARARSGDHGSWLSRDKIAAANLPSGIDPLIVTVGMLPIGIVCRPQDHNGIVDDVASVISVFGNTSWLISAGCAVATFLAAYFDGWSKEAALAQSLFVAKRGAVLGKNNGERAFVDQFQRSIDLYEPFGVTIDEADPVLPHRLSNQSVVVDGLALSYCLEDTRRALDLLIRLGDAPLLKATVAMLGAARDPWSVQSDRDSHPDVALDQELLSLTDQLIRIRVPQQISPPNL